VAPALDQIAVASQLAKLDELADEGRHRAGMESAL
jgi:hypothetical protein